MSSVFIWPRANFYLQNFYSNFTDLKRERAHGCVSLLLVKAGGRCEACFYFLFIYLFIYLFIFCFNDEHSNLDIYDISFVFKFQPCLIPFWFIFSRFFCTLLLISFFLFTFRWWIWSFFIVKSIKSLFPIKHFFFKYECIHLPPPTTHSPHTSSLGSVPRHQSNADRVYKEHLF